ncbi:MAG TPA: hypothetical protein VIR58_01480 [Acidimicrobiales bacterium]
MGAHLPGVELVDGSFPGGAALLAGEPPVAWVLLDENPIGSFGSALVVAGRQGASSVEIVVDDADAAGVIARRAALFAPPPRVWSVEGRSLVPTAPAAVPVPASSLPAPDLAELLVDADLEVVVEGGIVRGEVNGLEVARIVHGHTTVGEPIEEPLLEVGVGQADRELTGMLHGSLSPIDQLGRAVEIVRSLRRAGAEPHPLNQLAPERWLRARLVADPGRLGLVRLRPIEGAVPRPNLRDRAVAVALGEDAHGAAVVVACSVGVDLDLVPAAADARLAIDPDARLLLVVPARDAHPVTRDLAARLADPAEVVALEGDWRL